MKTEVQYRVPRILEEQPEITQRNLTEQLDVSVGKVDYCIKALIEKEIERLETPLAASGEFDH